MSHPSMNGAAGSIRDLVKISERRFDTRTLPADMQRVYKNLAKNFGEDYALLVMFTMRTGVELHRAWHMTLLTSKILQQLKDRFRLRMTWNLGVFRLQFRVQDGGNELYRKVPYDYDSEYQDIYMRIAIALMDGDITVHEALIFQSETKLGMHTAKSGIFIRDFPGRLILYPGVAATCAIIFFSGDWTDFYIACITGLVAGIVEMTLGILGAGVLTDISVGTTTGLIAGLFWRYGGEDICISSIFLGTLYWYFYGTAFVLGILEILAGELETGVTRFIAVSVKTFVLCLGASFGLLVVGNAQEVWFTQSENCARINLDDEWWRIPMYLLCSVFVLGQYRFPIVRYWRALIVMLAGYEVQYQMFNYFATLYDRDNVDTATSNIFGSAASVVSACAVSYWVNQLRYYYDAKILQPEPDQSFFGSCIYSMMKLGVHIGDAIGLGRKSDALKLKLESKLTQAKMDLKDPAHELQEIKLDETEENLILEVIVGAADMNIWSILMPALYQLVPGSMIAKLWFNYIFPPRLVTTFEQIEGTELQYKTYQIDGQANNMFAGLMIVSTSLALGLIIGFTTVTVFEMLFGSCFPDRLKNDAQVKRAKSRRTGMYSAPANKDDDPGSIAAEFHDVMENGVDTPEQADALFNAIDVDQSDMVDEGEATDYMLKAGLSKDQIQQLFASMDHDASGEVSREEFRRAVLEKKNKKFLKPEADVEPDAPQGPAPGDLNTGAANVSMLTGTFGPTEDGVEAGQPNKQLLEKEEA